MEFVEAGTACMNLVAAGATLWNSYRTISSDNRFWVNQKMFDHELSMQSAKFARERENNHCEAKLKILELGARKIDAFRSIINSAETTFQIEDF